jgi:hypothetical protein
MVATLKLSRAAGFQTLCIFKYIGLPHNPVFAGSRFAIRDAFDYFPSLVPTASKTARDDPSGTLPTSNTGRSLASCIKSSLLGSRPAL